MAIAGEPDFFSSQVTGARRFYLGNKPESESRFYVICGGMERCDPQYHLTRTKFPFLSVEFVVRGIGTFTTRGKTQRLLPGTVFSYGPGIEHEIVGDPQNPLVKYFVDLAGRDAGKIFKLSRLSAGGTSQTSAPEHLRRIFEDLIDAGLRRSGFQGDICAVIAQHLFLRIAESSIPQDAHSSIAFDTYETCRSYLEEHYREIESLTDMAARCDINPSYLCRIFRKYEGQTPWKLILQLRMHDAAERLQVRGTLVKNVAAELGFHDVFQFSRTFRRIFGVSPRRFSDVHRPRAPAHDIRAADRPKS